MHLSSKQVEEAMITLKSARWQDFQIGIYKFHHTKLEEKGAAVHGHRVPYTWRVKDTAKALGLSVGTVSQALNLVKHKDTSYIWNSETLIEALTKMKEVKLEDTNR